MSTRVEVVVEDGHHPSSRAGGSRLLLLVGAAALLASLGLGWDGGIRDLLTAGEVAEARRNGVLTAFDTAPSSAFGLLLPFGLALLALVVVVITVAVRGVAGRAEPVVLGGALACVTSLVVRGILDDAPGVPSGSLLAAGGLLVALAAATMLPPSPRNREPAWPVLALGLVAAALLTGMVHDAYAAVDLDESVLGGFGADADAGWPQRWLAAGVGARTAVDVALVVVASAGLVAAALAAARRLDRRAALGLVGSALVVLLGLLVLAAGPDPNVGGVDRFPPALAGMAALLAIAALALPAARVPAAPPEPEPAAPAAPLPPPPPERIAPPEAWAHPSRRPQGWWS